MNVQTNSKADEYHAASCNTSITKQMFSRSQEEHRESGKPSVQTHRADPSHSAVSLARDLAPLSTTLQEAITTRRSARTFSGKGISQDQLSRLLLLSAGIERSSAEHGEWWKRNVPHAGGLASVDVYPIVLNVSGLTAGIYQFDAVNHSLEQLKSGDFCNWLSEVVLFQPELARCSVLFVLTCAMGRLTEKYGLRAYRLGLLDAGHVSQNMQLLATAMGLGVCAISGYVDTELNDALHLDGLDNCAVLAVAVGQPAQA